VGLFDADIHGPNVPSMLEVTGPIYADDDGHPMPIESNGLRVMSIGLMEEGAPLAWRGAMAHDALTELFGDTAWGDLDTLVIDLPPGTGDVVLTTLQEVAVDGVVFVTTPFHAAVTDTQRSLELFRDNGVPILGIVVNMGSFTCPSCGDQHELFPGGTPLAGVDVPILAELPFSPDLQGTPTPAAVPEAFVALAGGVRDRLDEIGAISPPEDALDLRGADPEERRERVRRAYVDLEPGAAFVMLSDRDPTPVRQFLAEVAGVSVTALEPFDVTQLDPTTWRLETVKPE
jgi:ATP-binding protein involved in chromosome partitioning